MVGYTAAMPRELDVAYHDGPFGQIRSRSLGVRPVGVPEVVVVQGMGVSDYLLPGIAALATWTRAHLLELPGLSGSGEPPHELTVPEYADCVLDWLPAHVPGAVVIGGHSSGSQVAAHVAVHSPAVVGLLLAGPIFDPAARSWPRALLRWLWDGLKEPPSMLRLHAPEWRRAGLRRVHHLVRVHLADSLEQTLGRVAVPTLVLRGRGDPIATGRWSRHLTTLLPAAEYVEVAGPHSFPYRYPDAWSEPIRRLAGRPAPAR